MLSAQLFDIEVIEENYYSNDQAPTSLQEDDFPASWGNELEPGMTIREEL